MMNSFGNPTYWENNGKILCEDKLITMLSQGPPGILIMDAKYHPYASPQFCRKVRQRLPDSCVISAEQVGQLLVEGCMSQVFATDYMTDVLRNCGRYLIFTDLDFMSNKVASIQSICQSTATVVTEMGCTAILIGNKILLTTPQIFEFLPDAEFWEICGDR